MTLLRVIHGLSRQERQTTIDFCLSFARHADNVDVEYVNIHAADLTAGVGVADLTVVTYEVLAIRASEFWPDIERRILSWLGRSRQVALFPQDDYTCPAMLEELVFKSPCPVTIYSPIQQDRQAIYPRIFNEVEFRLALTGYLESEDSPPGGVRSLQQRPLDLVSRVRRLPLYFGKWARVKSEFSNALAAGVARAGLDVDVSDDPSRVFVGAAWLDFLASGRYTVASLGGASISDPYGNVQRRYQRFARRLPERKATTRALRAPHGEGNFAAISPRIFEAASCGTGLVLLEDHYLDGFEPWDHYLSVKPDLSNLDEVLVAMKDFECGQEMVSRAHRFLIDSGQFTYRTFVRNFLERELPNRTGNGFRSGAGRGAGIFDSCTDDELEGAMQIARRRFAWSLSRQKSRRGSGSIPRSDQGPRAPEPLVLQALEMLASGGFSMLGMVQPVTSADRAMSA